MGMSEQQEAMQHNMALIREYKKLLRTLEMQEAKYGLSAPAYIKVEIDDIRDKINELETTVYAVREDQRDLFTKAYRYYLTGDLGHAFQLFKQVREIDPNFPRIEILIRSVERELGAEYVDSDGRVNTARLLDSPSFRLMQEIKAEIKPTGKKSNTQEQDNFKRMALFSILAILLLLMLEIISFLRTNSISQENAILRYDIQQIMIMRADNIVTKRTTLTGKWRNVKDPSLTMDFSGYDFVVANKEKTICSGGYSIITEMEQGKGWQSINQRIRFNSEQRECGYWIDGRLISPSELAITSYEEHSFDGTYQKVEN